MQELKFWLQRIDSFNGYSIRGVCCATSTDYTDASDFAFGGYLATFTGEPVRGMFSPGFLLLMLMLVQLSRVKSCILRF